VGDIENDIIQHKDLWNSCKLFKTPTNFWFSITYLLILVIEYVFLKMGYVRIPEPYTHWITAVFNFIDGII
jgi:hypothetical protein